MRGTEGSAYCRSDGRLDAHGCVIGTAGTRDSQKSASAFEGDVASEGHRNVSRPRKVIEWRGCVALNAVQVKDVGSGAHQCEGYWRKGVEDDCGINRIDREGGHPKTIRDRKPSLQRSLCHKLMQVGSCSCLAATLDNLCVCCHGDGGGKNKRAAPRGENTQSTLHEVKIAIGYHQTSEHFRAATVGFRVLDSAVGLDVAGGTRKSTAPVSVFTNYTHLELHKVPTPPTLLELNQPFRAPIPLETLLISS